MAELTNVFAWSASRGKSLEECARQYFFTYYGSWNGWRAPAESPPAQLYLLKKLDTRWAWSGHVAHAVIGDAVKALLKGRDVSEAEQLERAHATMRRDFNLSRDRARARAPAKALRTLAGQKFFGLLEHELGLPVSDDEWRAIWKRTESQLQWWFRSHWPSTLASFGDEGPGAGAVVFTDDGDFSKNRFAFDDTHVLSAPDLAFLAPNGDAVAVDWKGGKPRHEHVAQVTGYGEQLGHSIGAPPDRVTTLLVYLGRGEVEEQLNAEKLEDWRGKVRRSISSMRSLLADPATNKPKPIEAFPLTSDVGRCRFCAFRRRCDRFNPGDAGDEKPADVPEPAPPA